MSTLHDNETWMSRTKQCKGKEEIKATIDKYEKDLKKECHLKRKLNKDHAKEKEKERQR